MDDHMVDALTDALPSGFHYVDDGHRWSALEMATFLAERLHENGWALVLLPQTPWAADEFRHLADRIHDLVADGTVAEVSEA